LSKIDAENILNLMLMKTFIHLLSLFLITPAFSQEIILDSIVPKLLKTSLISEIEVKKIIQLPLKDAIAMDLVQVLAEVEKRKIIGDDASNGWYFVRFSHDSLSIADRDQIRLRLTNYLQKLFECGLINEEQLGFQQKKIDREDYVHVLELLENIPFQAKLAQHMRPGTLKLWVNKLQNKAIISNKAQQLSQAIDAGEISAPLALLDYCEKAVSIPQSAENISPAEYISTIFGTTAGIMSELVYTNLNYQMSIDSTNSSADFKIHNLIIQLKSNGNWYRQRCTLFINRSEIYLDYEYYEIFNKILADLASPYRIHFIKTSLSSPTEKFKINLIALTKEQVTQIYDEGYPYFIASHENFNPAFTSTGLAQTLHTYQSIGLLGHLDSKEIDAVKIKVAEESLQDFNGILGCIPGLVYHLEDDLDDLIPYAKLLQGLSAITHGAFTPKEISIQVQSEKKVKLFFRVNKHSFNKSFKIKEDWINPKFFDYLNGFCKSLKLAGQFYYLRDGSSFIYLNTEQYKFVRNHKLAVFADQWQDVED